MNELTEEQTNLLADFFEALHPSYDSPMRDSIIDNFEESYSSDEIDSAFTAMHDILNKTLDHG